MEWMVNAKPRSLYPWERDPVPIVEEDVWAPGPIVHYKDQSVMLCGEMLLRISSGTPKQSVWTELRGVNINPDSTLALAFKKVE
jgi:hypothetical protein